MKISISLPRLFAIIFKEFIQLRRDKLTFAMLVAIPLMQLILFGYAINSNPHHLPTVVINADQSPFTRTFVSALDASTYFKIIDNNSNEQEADKLLAEAKIMFAVNIPPNFSHDLIRNEYPSLLVTLDATDPSASAYAVGALQTLFPSALNIDLQRGLNYLIPDPPPYNILIHAKYNPENITQFNIVPGLMGVVLTMTMILITSLAITRERERGTMESLLATPAQPLEVIVGKILPYIIIGYIQELLILIFSGLLFNVPMQGNLLLLLLATLPFIAANLTVGLTFSTIAKNQLQAMQMTFFFFLPSILLSGFMFPFYGMPIWAQWLGSCLPLTHFLLIVRGVLLKGNGIIEIWPQIWPILLFMIIMLLVGFKRYRRTLD